MEEKLTALSAADAELLDLGGFLGENRTVRIIANRCSAAEAAGLRRLREGRKYLRLAQDWQTFCAEFLGISKAQADRIIGLHQEFGDAYFDLAQLVRISPGAYRALEPSLKEGAILVDGAEVEICPENCREISRAVTELRRSLPPKTLPAPGIDDRLGQIDRQTGLLLEELEALLALTRSGPREGEVKSRMTAILEGLSRLELDTAA